LLALAAGLADVPLLGLVVPAVLPLVLLLLLLQADSAARPRRPAAAAAVAKRRFIGCATPFRSMTPRRRETCAGCVA